MWGPRPSTPLKVRSRDSPHKERTLQLPVGCQSVTNQGLTGQGPVVQKKFIDEVAGGCGKGPGRGAWRPGV